jgi:hypothetical protein
VIDRMPIWEVNEWVTESLAELKAERKRPPQTPAGPVSQQSPAGQDPAAAAHSADNSNIPHEVCQPACSAVVRSALLCCSWTDSVPDGLADNTHLVLTLAC